MTNLFGNLALAQSQPSTKGSGKPTLKALCTAKHYRHTVATSGEGFIYVQPIGGHKAVYNTGNKTYSVKENQLDMTKIFIGVTDKEDNYLGGFTLTPDKLFALIATNAVTDLSTIVESYGKHIDVMMNEQKAQGTYDASMFKIM